jgi:steroid delta-isomerase-like uncharacterized protein
MLSDLIHGSAWKGNSPKFAPEIATWLTRIVHMVDAPNTGLLLPFITLVRERSTGMSTEENKNLARRSWEIVNQRNPDLIEEFYPPEFVWHEPDRDVQGYEQAKQFVSSFFEAFPDLSITVDDVLAEGDQAVTRYTFRGTHQGETEEFGPPTGRQVELQGITIHRFEGGKIVEEWERYDNLSVLQQLGLAPEQ